MEVTFNATQTPVVEQPVPAVPSGVAGMQVIPAPASQVPTTTSSLALGDKLPDMDEVVVPRVNLSQNIGQLKESFPPGSFVYDKAVTLYSPAIRAGATVIQPETPPAILTVLGFWPTRFFEKVAGGAPGLQARSEEQVTALGGTLDYQEWELKKSAGMKLFQPFADALIAIQKPEAFADEDHSVFTWEVEGKFYVLAKWGMQGGSYTEAAKRVFFTHRKMGCLQKGYPTFSYAVTVFEKVYRNGNKAWVPACRPLVKNTPAFLEFARTVLNS
jgi:hypothetical protein